MATKLHRVIVTVVNEDGWAGAVGRFHTIDEVWAVTASYSYASYIADGIERLFDGVRVEGPDVPKVAPIDFNDEANIPF